MYTFGYTCVHAWVYNSLCAQAHTHTCAEALHDTSHDLILTFASLRWRMLFVTALPATSRTLQVALDLT